MLVYQRVMFLHVFFFHAPLLCNTETSLWVRPVRLGLAAPVGRMQWGIGWSIWVVYDIALLALKLDATHGTLQINNS